MVYLDGCYICCPIFAKNSYRVFRQFRQSEFAYGGSIFKPIFAIAQADSTNDTHYKSSS
jgi:hypothetical protein